MSIAAISSSFVTAVRASANGAPVPPVVGAPAISPPVESGGRRHELVDAMNQVLGLQGEPSKAQDQAVFRFAHALMQDLRSLDGGAGAGAAPGRGHAWGRREWSDLPQRIDTLATAAGVAASAAVLTAPPTQPAAPTASSAAPTAPVSVLVAPALEAEPVAVELPMQPNPVTTTSAAVHLMQVPTSRLLEAFAALHLVLNDQAEPATPSANRADLASLLNRLGEALGAGAAAELPAGSVLNLTA